ncbi:MAG: hypothetical protein ACJ77N_05140 [Chloroflexota bacterium]|jgi:hypothetical protein
MQAIATIIDSEHLTELRREAELRRQSRRTAGKNRLASLAGAIRSTFASNRTAGAPAI